MAPLPPPSSLNANCDLIKRYIYYYGESTWYCSGRWALAGVLIGVFVLFVLGFTICCCTARRRRASGRTPYTGTAWTMRVPGIRAPPPSSSTAYGPPPETSYVSQQDMGYLAPLSGPPPEK